MRDPRMKWRRFMCISSTVANRDAQNVARVAAVRQSEI
jgi:hypothetical protein